MTAHFDRYISLVLARAQAENESRADIGEPSQQISRDAIEDFDKTLASMRFSATAAREHAISTIPQSWNFSERVFARRRQEQRISPHPDQSTKAADVHYVPVARPLRSIRYTLFHTR